MPSGFFIGSFYIRFYGIILMLGAMAAAFWAEREARRRGLNSELVWDALLWVLIGGIVGARLWHVFTPPPSMIEQGFTTYWYLTHPLDLINTRAGGLGIPGGIIGGGLAAYVICRRRKQDFRIWADITAPGLALAQAIGRFGNYFNQELYGKPSTLPWAITIEPAYRLPQYKDIATYHPLFLYESLLSLVNLVFLIWLGRRYAERLKPGDIFLSYLVTYPVVRFFLEFLRLDAPTIGDLNTNQAIMAVVAVLSFGLLLWRHRRKEKPLEAERTE